MTMSSFPFQKGFSLIELMISLAISSILILGIVVVLTSNQGTSRSNQQLAKINSDIRSTYNQLAATIRIAGYSSTLNRLPALSVFAFLTPILGSSARVDSTFYGRTFAIEGITTPTSSATGHPINEFSLPTSLHYAILSTPIAYGAVSASDAFITRSLSPAYHRAVQEIRGNPGIATEIFYGGYATTDTSGRRIGGTALPPFSNVGTQQSILYGGRDRTTFGLNRPLLIVSDQMSEYALFSSDLTFSNLNQGMFTVPVCDSTSNVGDLEILCQGIQVFKNTSTIFPAGSRVHGLDYKLFYLCNYDSNLRCTDVTADVAGVGLVLYTGLRESELLVENARVMRIQYGTPDDNGVINQFRTAADIIAANEWDEVTAVRMGLIVEIPNYRSNEIVPNVNDVGINQLFGETVTVPLDPADLSSSDAFTTASTSYFRKFEAVFYAKSQQ